MLSGKFSKTDLLMKVTGESIMIFGAGLNQLELIREAKKLGLKTVVIDPQPDPYGKLEADFFYRIDGKDYETTREIALNHKVSGIITGQMEKPLRIMARLAQELGLIFNSPKVTERCIDKWLMKEAFMDENIPCASGTLIKMGEAIPAIMPEKMTFPVIIKPRDAYSSRGVYKCDSIDEVKERAVEARSYSSTGDILLEEFMEGKELSVEAVTYRGETTIIQFTEKFITPYPNTVELGHLQPAEMTKEDIEVCSTLVKKALRALGIKNSVSHTEIKMTTEGPKIIETGARLGGDFISSYLTKASTGISMDRAAIQIALGEHPDLTSNERAFSYIKYLELPPGKVVKEIGNWEEALGWEDVVMADLTLKTGDIIPEVTDSAKRPGFIIVKGRTREEVVQKAERYCLQLLKHLILN